MHDAHYSATLSGILSRCLLYSDYNLDQERRLFKSVDVPCRAAAVDRLACTATSFKSCPDTCCGSTAAVACHSLLFFSLSSVTAWHSAPACSHGPEPDLLPVCRSYTGFQVQQARRLIHQLSHCCSCVCTSDLCLMHNWVMQVYTESTDGSYLDVKESALVWHYKDADPDFGRWQAKVRHTLPADCICFVPCHHCSHSQQQGMCGAHSLCTCLAQSPWSTQVLVHACLLLGMHSALKFDAIFHCYVIIQHLHQRRKTWQEETQETGLYRNIPNLQKA